MMHKRIMVTGGSAVAGDGLKSVIGKGEYPGRDFIFPTSKECDLLDAERTKEFVASYKPDAIIHFAAISGGIQLSIDHPAKVLRDNIVLNFNIMEAARLAGVKKVLMTLSAAIYPLDAPVPRKEEQIHNGYPHESNYSYAFAKRLIDPMAKAYQKEFGMNVVGMIPGAIIGPRSNFDPKASSAVPGMIRRFYENREGKEPLVIWGDGTQIRQFTSDEDTGRIAMWFIDNHDDPRPLNVGNIEETSIGEAAYIIAESLKLDPKRIIFDPSKPAGMPRQTMDTAKFDALSHFKYVPARDVIKRTVDYFVAHYPDGTKLRL